jgi:hypothetical protein
MLNLFDVVPDLNPKIFMAPLRKGAIIQHYTAGYLAVEVFGWSSGLQQLILCYLT